MADSQPLNIAISVPQPSIEFREELKGGREVVSIVQDNLYREDEMSRLQDEMVRREKPANQFALSRSGAISAATEGQGTRTVKDFRLSGRLGVTEVGMRAGG